MSHGRSLRWACYWRDVHSLHPRKEWFVSLDSDDLTKVVGIWRHRTAARCDARKHAQARGLDVRFG